jgi:hypothetical protein
LGRPWRLGTHNGSQAPQQTIARIGSEKRHRQLDEAEALNMVLVLEKETSGGAKTVGSSARFRGLGARHHWVSPTTTIVAQASTLALTAAVQAPRTKTAAHASSMAAASTEDNSPAAARDETQRRLPASNGEGSAEEEDGEDEDDDDDDNDDDDEAEEEAKLKYTRLTSSLGPVYRNGDATSTFVVVGDKMVRRVLPESF